MKIQVIILNLGTICMLSSCGYKMITVTAIDGEKYRIRQYSNFDKGERYENRLVYKLVHKEQEYPIFSGKITSDTAKGDCFIQFDSTMRIYLQDSDKQYASLFKTGLVYPKMIFCATDSCRPLYDYTDTLTGDTSKATIVKYGKLNSILYKIKGNDTINWVYSNNSAKIPENAIDIKYYYTFPRRKDKYGWKGISITIRYIKELKYLEKSNHKRVFKFEIAVYDERLFNPTDYRYFIDIENDNATRKTKFDDFVKNAKVNFFYLFEAVNEN